MTKKDLLEKLEFPEGVSITEEKKFWVIKGPEGNIKKRFDNPRVKIEVKDKEIHLFSKQASKKEKAIIQAYKAHIKNAFKGCQKPFVYKLKICSGHFPMSVSISNNILIIKNFLGEKVPRKVKLKEGVEVKVEGNNILVISSDRELAGQVAADIEQKTRRPGFDKRIFQDGIYVTEKSGKRI